MLGETFSGIRETRKLLNQSDALVERIYEIVPNAVCATPKVRASGVPISNIQVNGFMLGIQAAWSHSRRVGAASMTWDVDELIIRSGASRSGYVFRQNTINRRRNKSLSVCTEEVLKAICSYRLIKDYLQERVAHSYSEIISIAGGLSIKTDDDVIRKVMDDYQTGGRSMVAPTGSSLGLSATSLVDIERVIDIYYREIAHEAVVPLWLWLETPPATVYDTAERAKWLQREFSRVVEPALDWLLSSAGYIDVSIELPTYRDEMFTETLIKTRAETNAIEL